MSIDTTPQVITLDVQHGRSPLSDGSGGRKGGLIHYHRAGANRRALIASWDGVPEADRSDFIARALRSIEARYGVTAWYWDGCRVTSEKPKPSSKPKPCHTLCLTTVHYDSWSMGTCARPVPEGETKCGIHAAADRKVKANDEARRAKYAKRSAERDREAFRTADLRALWSEACDLYDIDPARRGTPSVSGRTATVDDEVLTRLLRTLIERS